MTKALSNTFDGLKADIDNIIRAPTTDTPPAINSIQKITYSNYINNDARQKEESHNQERVGSAIDLIIVGSTVLEEINPEHTQPILGESSTNSVEGG